MRIIRNQCRSMYYVLLGDNDNAFSIRAYWCRIV